MRQNQEIGRANLNFLNSVLKRLKLLNKLRSNKSPLPIIWLILVCTLMTRNLLGQPVATIGLPGVVHFTEQDFSAGLQNWMITQDSARVMYFGNSDGLLTYNGNNWSLFPLPNKTLLRSLIIGKDGKIFAGGQDELGYYFPDSKGTLVYHSLKDRLPEVQRSFADVWNIGISGGKVYFRCTDRIFAMDTSSGSQKALIYPAPDEWVYMAATEKGVFAQDRKLGLLQYLNGKWQVRSPYFKGKVITSILETAKGGFLITTLKNGVYLLNEEGLSAVNLPGYIIDAHIYTAAGINGVAFALGTTSDGVYIIDEEGAILRHFNGDTRLQNNNVLSIFIDREDNLWLGLDKGIDLLDYNSSIQTIRPVYNTPAACYTALIYKDQLVIGTSDGLYKTKLTQPKTKDLSYSRGDFSKVEGSSGQVWGLYNTGKHLLMGHNEGIFQVDDDRAHLLYKQSGAWQFQAAVGGTRLSGPWVSGTYIGLQLLKDSLGRIVDGGRIEGSPFESLRFVAMDEVHHIIWASHPYRGVYGLQMAGDMRHVLSVRLYTEKDGLPVTLNNYVNALPGQILFGTEKGIYRYDADRDRFFPDTVYGKILGTLPIKKMRQDSKGRLWFVTEKRLGVYIPSRGIRYFPEVTGKMISGFEFILPVNDQNILIGSNDGLIHINMDRYQSRYEKVEMLLTKVSASAARASSDSLLFDGYFVQKGRVVKAQPTAGRPRLPARFNSFHFEYTATSYQPPREFEYSFQLEGFDEGWSGWSLSRQKDYTNLPHGSYRFLVKARDQFGVESKVKAYEFIIEPFWYQTNLAFLIYILVFFAALIYMRRVLAHKFEAQRLQHEEEQKQLKYLHQLELEHSEKEIIQLQKEKLEAEVSFKNKELASTTMHLFKRGKLLSKLKEELTGAIKKLPEDASHTDFTRLVKMLSEAEKQDADWEQFAIHFDEVHNNFLFKLRKAYPELTAADLKICAYIKMNLSSKQMAQLLNISLKGVEVARYRLRKKIDIPSQQTSLYDFLNTVTELTDIEDKG